MNFDIISRFEYTLGLKHHGKTKKKKFVLHKYFKVQAKYAEYRKRREKRRGKEENMSCDQEVLIRFVRMMYSCTDFKILKGKGHGLNKLA